MSALSEIVAKFRRGSPNIAAAFDEVERRLVLLEQAAHGHEPPPPTFGGLLPPRLAESTGPEVQISTLAQLRTIADFAAPGTRVRITAPLDGQGGQLSFNCHGTAEAPILFTGAAPVRNFSQWYIPNAAYVRFRGLEMSAMQVALKPTGVSHHIEIDGCWIHHCSRQGILISPTGEAPHIQVWNNRVENNGSQANLDHGIYWARARPGDVLANNLLIDNWAYQIQLYPDCVGLIVTCNRMDGGARHVDERGGLVIGSEGTAATRDCTIVGLVGYDAPANGVVRINQPIGPTRCFDSTGWGNGDTDFEPDPNMQYVNCQHGGSPKGLVQPPRYGYVPPFDINGRTRVTADAGCFAL